METYRLSSKLVEDNREFLIQTANDAKVSTVMSSVLVNGSIAETSKTPHPIEYTPGEVLSLVKSAHNDKKREVEAMLQSYRAVLRDGDAQTLYQLGTAFFYKSFLAEARQLFNAAIGVDTDYHQAYNYISMAELAGGNLDAAVRAARVAVDMRPGFADYHYNLGHAYLTMKSCRKAVNEFEEAIRINLYYGDAYFSLGLALLKNALMQEETSLFAGVLTRSVDNLKKASIIDPDYDNEVFAEGIKAVQGSDLPVGHALLSKVFQEKKERRFRELAAYYMKYVYAQDDLSEQTLNNRIQFLEDELKKNPSYVDLHVELASCHLNRARFAWQHGIEHYRKALDINPSLSKAGEILDAVEEESHKINAVVEKISEGC